MRRRQAAHTVGCMFTPLNSELMRVLVDQRTRPAGRRAVRERVHEEQRRRVRESLLLLPEPPTDVGRD
jgi:hypothetical protein